MTIVHLASRIPVDKRKGVYALTQGNVAFERLQGCATSYNDTCEQVLSSYQVQIVLSTLGALALHGRLVVALLWKAGDENTREGKNAVTYLPLWLWLVREFGVAGALVSYLMLLSWIVTPVLLALLYRKSLALQRYLTELSDRLAIQSRQQQVERLKRDGARKKPGRRR